MIIKIVGAGEDHFSELYKPDDNEYLIGVDGGIKVLQDNNLKINLAVGDFDSFTSKKIPAKKVITLEKIKDQSDLAVSIEQAIAIDHEKIIIYNVTGKRLDHFYGAILELFKFPKHNIEIQNLHNKIYAKQGEFIITKSSYKYVSFFAFEETKITLEGFKYPLSNYLLTPYDPLCLSNEIITNQGIVKTNKNILVIESK